MRQKQPIVNAVALVFSERFNAPTALIYNYRRLPQIQRTLIMRRQPFTLPFLEGADSSIGLHGYQDEREGVDLWMSEVRLSSP